VHKVKIEQASEILVRDADGSSCLFFKKLISHQRLVSVAIGGRWRPLDIGGILNRGTTVDELQQLKGHLSIAFGNILVTCQLHVLSGRFVPP
jgi:hypothetical protein